MQARKLLRLPPSRRRILLESFKLVLAVRAGLYVMKWTSVRALLARWIEATRKRPPDDATVDDLAWAVSASARRVPAATCLTQALVLHALLQARHLPAVLRIGVSRDSDGRFVAHAWVESDGRVVIGGDQAGEYQPLLSLEGAIL